MCEGLFITKIIFNYNTTKPFQLIAFPHNLTDNFVNSSDEFVVETVVSSNEMLTDEAGNVVRPFGEASYSAVVATKEHIGGLHNAYVAAGTFATAIFIVAIVVSCLYIKD